MSESGEAAASHTAVAKSGREITMTRTFDAPAHLVFEAYSTREHLMKWFGPEGYPVTMCEIDFRVGGKWRMAMTGPEGVQQTPFGGEYREIIPNKKIVFDNGFEEPGAPRMVMTVILDEDGSRTKLTFHTLFESEEMAKEYAELGFVDGTASGLDNLADLLASLGDQAQAQRHAPTARERRGARHDERVEGGRDHGRGEARVRHPVTSDDGERHEVDGGGEGDRRRRAA